MFTNPLKKKETDQSEEAEDKAIVDNADQAEDPLPANPTENFEGSQDGYDLKEEQKDEIAGATEGEGAKEKDPDAVPLGCIRLPEDTDLIKFVQDCYDLSSPQGLGHAHYNPEPLPANEAEQIVKRSPNGASVALSMDYINGRAVKMTVHRNEAGSLFIRGEWFDHTKAEFYRLLQRTKVKGIKLERDVEKEEEIKKQRSVNPFKTVDAGDDHD